MALRSGRYETLRVIASGGMATVYLARAHGAGGFERLVALKVMHPHIASDPEFVDMFLDEARLAARIHHPNVVGTSDVQEDASGLFLVMDYIEGASLQLILRDLWRHGRTIRLDIALRVFLDALAGLHAAHELRDADGQPLHLVHRDVSPQNILVGIDGVSRLTDFGVARARSRISSTQGTQLKGKLTYMAPEHVRCEPVDRRADVYASGVVLWEMLAGQRLFRMDSDAAIVQGILEGVTRSPLDVSPEVPAPIARVCMRALSFEPQDRFPTAAELAEALEEAADEAGVHIATTRGVAIFMKELDLHPRPEPAAIARAAACDAPTMPAPLAGHAAHMGDAPLTGDESTERDKVTVIDGEAHPMRSADRSPSGAPSAPPISLPPASSFVRAMRDVATRGRIAVRHRVAMGMMILAGIAMAGSLTALMARAIRTLPEASAPPLLPLSGGVPLDPPASVDVPVAPPEPSSTTAGDQGGGPVSGALGSSGGRSSPFGGGAPSRDKAAPSQSSKPAPRGGKAAPSPTTFRPREL